MVVGIAAAMPLQAQDPPVGTLPPGPAPGPQHGPLLVDALFVQANMIQGGEVLFLVPAQEPDADDNPQPPAVFLKVNGKSVRAFGANRQPLDIPELETRLSRRAAAVVVHSHLPDSFFLSVLNERSVIFVVTRKQFQKLARSTASPMSLAGYWNVLKPGEGTAIPSGDVWNISETKCAIHRQGKLVGHYAYRLDDGESPMTVDLTPDFGQAKGRMLKGIFELDGLRLKVCYRSPELPENVERPREFGEQGTVTVVLGLVLP
jgi:uncharacterized protein (TIGR03067 family)